VLHKCAVGPRGRGGRLCPVDYQPDGRSATGAVGLHLGADCVFEVHGPQRVAAADVDDDFGDTVGHPSDVARRRLHQLDADLRAVSRVLEMSPGLDDHLDDFLLEVNYHRSGYCS